jgi:effector-binding domain-containing protein
VTQVQFEVVEVPTETVAQVRRVVPMADLREFFDESLPKVAEDVSVAGGRLSGPPFGWYHGRPGETVDVAVGFPVAGDVHSPEGGVTLTERPGGRCVVGVHVGPYDRLEETYAGLMPWMAEHHLVPREDMWEEYLSEPSGDPSTWQTRIVVPLADG